MESVIKILSESLSVFRRCFVHQTFKVVVEIRKVVVATVVTNLGNRFFSFNKHFRGNTNPDTFHILRKSPVGLFLKIPAK